MKELVETNKMLRRLVSRLESSGGALGPDILSEISSTNGDHLTYADAPGMYGHEEVMDGNLHLSSSTGVEAPMYEHQNGEAHHVDQYPGGVVNNAVRTLMKNPNLVDPLTVRLNEVIAARLSEGSAYNPNNDSMYEQVMGSELVEQLLDQLIPPVPAAPMDAHLELAHPAQMTTYDFSEVSNGPQFASMAPNGAAHVSNLPTTERRRLQRPRAHGTSTLLNASTQHPSIHIKTVASPSTPQMAHSPDFAISTPQPHDVPLSAPKPPLTPGSSATNPKKRFTTSPEAPHAKKRRDK